MDAFESCYLSIAKSIQTVGQMVFVPYASLRIMSQIIRYVTLNVLSYIRLTFVYYHHLLHIRRESNHDKETFELSFNQRKRNNKIRVRKHNLPVASNVCMLFDPPVTFGEFLLRIWFRAGYYYDRYIINFPIDVINGSTKSYMYEPNPQIKLPSNLLESANAKIDNTRESNLKIDFVPKPYVITKCLEAKSNPEKPVLNGCPVLSELFVEKVEDSTNGNGERQSKETKEQTVATIAEVPNKLTSNRSLFYKIKIKRKHSKHLEGFKDHPTYGRYDLVEQAIKNVIPQPEYKPDGTIGPNLIRFTWHCCAHYDRVSGTGGSSGGTMRFAQEFNDLGNTGLTTSKSYLDQVHEQFPWISFADLYIFGGVVAIQAIGGPKIEWKAGRTDCPGTVKVPPMGRLPMATKNYNHIKDVFYGRLGFNAQETVALIGGGHGIGGCHARYSGFNGIWTKTPFSWNNDFFKVLLEENWSLGIVPQTGIEQYYNDDKSLMMLNTDIELLRCPEFRRWVEIYANDSNYFNEQFALAFAKLLELGVIRDPDGIQRVKI